MFIGRERELDVLNKLYHKKGFQMPVIYGRRRVGKTRLIREFVMDKPVIFYTATIDESSVCLRDFTACIKEFDKENAVLQGIDSFQSWDAAFDYITKLAEKEKLIIVIDEYPYLARSYTPISSILQRCIDTKWKENNLYLILAGSSMSFMEKQVLGYESPLYGRRTAQIKLKKLDYADSVKFFPHWNRDEALYAYGMCDGIPQYLEIFSRWDNLREAVENEFLMPTGGMIDEPELLLKEELREPALYNSIIEAVANGANRSSEIAGKVGKQANALAPYLSNLVSLDILEKSTPVGENAAKKTIYRVQDKLYYFWYHFIPKCRFQIAMGLWTEAYEQRIYPFLPEYFGHVFEDICLQYILRKTADRSISTIYDDYGKWWGNDPVKKCQEEIDLVAVSNTDILIGECKWQTEPVGFGVYNLLVERGNLIRNNREVHYYLFSKSGFEENLKAYEEKHLTLVDLDKILGITDVSGVGDHA